MKTISIIVTVLALFGYAISTYLFINDPIAHSTKEGIHIFNFFIWFIIPIILWVVYLLFQYPNKLENVQPPNDNNSNDYHTDLDTDYVKKELAILEKKIKEYSKERSELLNDVDLLKRSFEQKFIDNLTFISQEKKMKEKISQVENSNSYCEKRTKAVEILKNELIDLEQLVKKGIMDDYEMEAKRRKLINELINEM